MIRGCNNRWRCRLLIFAVLSPLFHSSSDFLHWMRSRHTNWRDNLQNCIVLRRFSEWHTRALEQVFDLMVLLVRDQFDDIVHKVTHFMNSPFQLWQEWKKNAISNLLAWLTRDKSNELNENENQKQNDRWWRRLTLTLEILFQLWFLHSLVRFRIDFALCGIENEIATHLAFTMWNNGHLHRFNLWIWTNRTPVMIYNLEFFVSARSRLLIWCSRYKTNNTFSTVSFFSFFWHIFDAVVAAAIIIVTQIDRSGQENKKIKKRKKYLDVNDSIFVSFYLLFFSFADRFWFNLCANRTRIKIWIAASVSAWHSIAFFSYFLNKKQMRFSRIFNLACEKCAFQSSEI